GATRRRLRTAVTAVLAASVIVGLSGSTAGAWSSEDGAVAVWEGADGVNANLGDNSFGGYYKSLAVDTAGNIYLTTQFQNTVDFNPSPFGTTIMTAAGCGTNGLVMKLDSFANPYWARQFDGSSSCYANPTSIAVDGNGNVYTTGEFNGTVDFDPGAGVTNLVNSYVQKIASYISKLNSSGEFVWAYRLGSAYLPGQVYDGGNSGLAKAKSVAADGSGNVYVVGSFEGSVDFQHGAGVTTLSSSSSQREDVFILKLNSSGALVWIGQIENPGSTKTLDAHSVAVDGSGNVYISGFVTGGSTVDFDPTEGVANLATATGGQGAKSEIWILKLDSAGDYVWAKASSCPGSAGAYRPSGSDRGLAVDDSGNVYAVGSFTQEHYNDSYDCDFDPGPGEGFAHVGGTSNHKSGLVWKLDSSGNYQWAKAFLKTACPTCSNDSNEALSVAVDGSGNVYTAGRFLGPTDFDPGAGTATLTGGPYSGNHSAFLSKLDSSGDYVWAKQVGTLTGSQSGRQVALDGSGNVYFSGFLNYETVDLDPGDGVVNFTSKEMFLVKLDSSGNLAAGASAGVTVSKTTATVTEAGASDSFTVVLDTQPTSDVVLAVTSSDTGEAVVSPSPLTFTSSNWDTAQTVTVTGVDDIDVDGNQVVPVIVSVDDDSSAASYRLVADSTVNVTNTDNDSVTQTDCTLQSNWNLSECACPPGQTRTSS
ncbi:uncharacterized protein METZ01_LOCUS166525, partial [marine metagenome]